MKIMRATPNESGAFPPIQEGSFTVCPEGFVVVPDDMDTTAFYANGGFVSRTVKDGVVTAMTGDTAKWAQWQTDHPASAEPTTPTKTDAERIAELEAALAAMKEATN